MTRQAFITMGNSPYFPTIALSAIQASRFHPDALFVIYDWGLHASEKEYLSSLSNTMLVDWKDNFRDSPFADSYFNAMHRVLHTRRGLKELVRKGLRGKEWLLAQKPWCFLDWFKRMEAGSTIFLDGDAFLLNKVPELFNGSFDLGVTLRRKTEISVAAGNYQLLNSGVIVFNAKPQVSASLVHAWLDKMNECSREYLVEQTALSKLVYDRENTDPGYGQQHQLQIESQSLSVLTLSCEQYNYNWIEEGVDAEKNRILHFKGGRHSGQRLRELLGLLELDDLVSDILDIHKV